MYRLFEQSTALSADTDSTVAYPIEIKIYGNSRRGNYPAVKFRALQGIYIQLACIAIEYMYPEYVDRSL